MTPGLPGAAAPGPRIRAGWTAGLRGLAVEVGAGVTVGCLMLPFCVTAGVLAYEPLGVEHTAEGAAAGILCAVAGGLVGALARSSSFIPNIPSVAMALVQAAFVTTLLEAFGGDPRPALMLMPLSVILAGLFQIAIAASGLGRAVKFTPYPVLAGFVTGLAVLTFVQQAPRMFGEAGFSALLSSLWTLRISAPAIPILGVAVILAILALEKWAPRLPAMLVALVLGTAAWHAAKMLWPDLALGRTIGPVSLDQAMFGFLAERPVLEAFWQDPHCLRALVLTSATIALLGALDFTFAFRSAQTLCDLPPAPRRDLAGQGASNVFAALAGGLAVTSSIAFARTNFETGGRGRVSTVAASCLLLLAALLAPSLIAALPIPVLAALLVSIALRMWDRWCVVVLRDLAGRTQALRQRARRNAAIVLTVMAATVLGQPVAGALVGVGLSCLVFIMEMSRPVIRRRLDGTQVDSKRIRSQPERAALLAEGDRIVVLDLQGVLFFGNADDLASEVKAMPARTEIVILDLKRIRDVDTSGAAVLGQIATRCGERHIRLMLADAHPGYGPLLRAALASQGATPADATLHPDLDHALEEAEDIVLRRYAPDRMERDTLRLDQTDLAAGLSEAELEALRGRLTACRFGRGEALCEVGDPADRLWIILKGGVSVRLAGPHHALRVAGLGPGTTVGEMGLLDRRPRSANVVADEDVEALVLTADGFEDLLRDVPHLGQSLLATIARLTAQRLRATSDELRLAEV